MFTEQINDDDELSVLGASTSYASYDVWDGLSTKTPSLLWFKHSSLVELTTAAVFWLDPSPKFMMDKFQKVLSAAARVISNSRKYDRGLTYTRRHELHWLDVPERSQFRTAVTVHRCLNGLAPAYLILNCAPLSHRVGRAVAYGRHRRSVGQTIHRLSVVLRLWPYRSECSTWLPEKSHSFHWCLQTLLKNFFYLLSINTTL